MLLSTENPTALTAPSVTVKPLPLEKVPTFDEILHELGVAKPTKDTKYMVDCRILDKDALRTLINERAKMLVTQLEAQKVDRGTQTFVSITGKTPVKGCVNCLSGDHHFKHCSLPYRPGFCHICGAQGFDKTDCIYPHGIEHEMALNRCFGCSGDLQLYNPECPDCNIRFPGLSDYLRLNYASWPAWMIPSDHRYLHDEAEKKLKREGRAKFTDPKDHPNKVRAFLIRENALLKAKPANPEAQSAQELSENKRKLALKALLTPGANKTLDKIMEERPELYAGEEVTVLIPTKAKKTTKERCVDN